MAFMLIVFKILLDQFCAFQSRTFVDCSSKFFTLSYFIFSDLYCALSYVKLVAKMKLIAAQQEGGHISRVGSASGQGVESSDPGVINYFCTLKEKFI